VSNLFVIDVDGPKAHAALISRLGGEAVAPKALFGCGMVKNCGVSSR
jgi:hypothetical protein